MNSALYAVFFVDVPLSHHPKTIPAALMVDIGVVSHDQAAGSKNRVEWSRFTQFGAFYTIWRLGEFPFERGVHAVDLLKNKDVRQAHVKTLDSSYTRDIENH